MDVRIIHKSPSNITNKPLKHTCINKPKRRINWNLQKKQNACKHNLDKQIKKINIFMTNNFLFFFFLITEHPENFNLINKIYYGVPKNYLKIDP